MSDKAIFGVCSGFAKYFDIDPIVIRLGVVLLALMGTLGIWFYVLAAIIMPKDTDTAYAHQPRYDAQTGRPLYEAGGNVYENCAGVNQQAAPVQDAEFTATAYGPTETCRSADSAFDNSGFASESFEASADSAETTAADSTPEDTSAAGTQESASETGTCGDTSGSWTEPKQNNTSQSSYSAGQSYNTCQTGNGQAKQDPYKNFQGYQAQSQQTQQTQSAAQSEPRSSRRSRNTGILLIIIGVVILAKIVLPKINIWIPISIASIFFGIYLCCRKK